MNTHYTYFLILAAAVAGPLGLSFDKKVAFYKKWPYVFRAMIIPALLYIAWDMFFTQKGVWSFNPAYITGITISNLPLEEVLFFFIVPYCCLFIYECIRSYFPKLQKKAAADVLLQLLAAGLLIASWFYRYQYYTSWTFLFTAFFIGLLYTFPLFFKGFDAAAFLVAYGIIVIPFLVVNGFLTALPVVLYNDLENCRLRIYTIPFEDIFYGMLLMLMIVAIYEKDLKRI